MRKFSPVEILIIVMIVGAILIGIAGLYQANSRHALAFDPLNATYTVEGQPITLVDGKAQSPAAPGSATQVMTSVFGQPMSGDLNADGKGDAALILVQNPGGSGTFYYVVAAVNTSTGTQGTNAILLGDRIAPQNIQIQDGKIVVNYADRKPGEPMTTPPSVAMTKYIVLGLDGMLQELNLSGAGGPCGGNMVNPPSCMTGYHCATTPGRVPSGDIGGKCVPN